MLARFTPNQTPFLVLKVPRASLLEDSLAFLRSVPDSDLTKELKIEFVGEQGVDAGGLKKEFFQLLVPQLFDPVVGMFSKTANEEVFFNAACDWYLDEYELAGYWSVCSHPTPSCSRCGYLWRPIKSSAHNGDSFEPSLSDLQELDADLAKGLKQLLAFDGDVENIFCRTFEDDDPAGLPGATIELMPNGASTPVTNDNREDYVNALCDYRLKEAVRTQFDRFAKGFWRVLGQSSIERVVEAEELRVMVQGDEAPLDWAALQDVCAYEGFGEAVGDASPPPEDGSGDGGDSAAAASSSDSDSDASDSSGEPLFGAVTEPRVADGDGDAATPDGGAEAAAPGAHGTRTSPRRSCGHGAFDDALQRDFLMFVTGSKTAPMGGLGALRPPAHASFKVQRAGPDSDALPTSHTCFNTLLLPEYDPPQKVAKLLEYAVREGHEGFALE